MIGNLQRMKIAASLTFLGVSSLLAGCVGYRVADDGISRAGFMEAVYVDGPKVTPLELLEDSRCPADVQCVWAGRVRINAKVHLGSRDETHELTLGQSVQVADGELTLVEVNPEAKSGRNIYPEEYRFGFTFAGGL